MVLATIITSLANFLKISNSDVDLIDVMGEGDEHTNLEDDMFAIDFSSEKSDATTSGASSTQDRIPLPSTSTSNPRFKKKVAESWDDAALDDDAGSPSDTSGDEEGSIGGAKDRSVEEIERGFINIYKALSMLRLEFDTKFKKIFA